MNWCSWRFYPFALSVLVTLQMMGGTAFGAGQDKDAYTIADLEALATKGAYRELYDHLRDIRPAGRDARWEKVAETAAKGLLEELADSGKRARLLDEMIKEFPSFKKSKALAALVDTKNLKDYEQCFAHGGGDYCTEGLRRYAMLHKDSPDTIVASARLMAVKMAPWTALEFYLLALKQGDSAGVSRICEDNRLDNAVVSGLMQKSGEPVDNARLVAGKYCWKQVAKPVLEQLHPGNSYYMANACPMALKNKALSGVRKKKCEKLVKQ